MQATSETERFHCTVPGCTRSFLGAAQLRYHEKTQILHGSTIILTISRHDKVYLCPYCPDHEPFSSASTLNRHLRNRHHADASAELDMPKRYGLSVVACRIFDLYAVPPGKASRGLKKIPYRPFSSTMKVEFEEFRQWMQKPGLQYGRKGPSKLGATWDSISDGV